MGNQTPGRLVCVARRLAILQRAHLRSPLTRPRALSAIAMRNLDFVVLARQMRQPGFRARSNGLHGSQQTPIGASTKIRREFGKAGRHGPDFA
ncbi:MAG: hypothetical protein J2P31_18185 [Blastocatellia bacterium]|nr:hypothetical protein [Blastocatellia bacterium]